MRASCRTILTVLTAVSAVACSPKEREQAAASVAAANADMKRVAVTAIVEHPALDSVRRAAVAQLAAEGFVEGENLSVEFQSAQGNPATAAQIAKKFAGEKPDVIIAIGTPSAQAVAAAGSDIPVVYSAVTDPVAAKLVSDWGASGGNITGVSDQLPLAPQIELMKQLVPNLKRVGYVYSPGEVNSTVVLQQLEADLKAQGIAVEAVPAQRTTDVLTAARSLAGKADLIYTSLDNNVVSAYESMYKAANEIKVPLLASDTGSVPRGAVAALGVNYQDIGTETGKIVARILKGEAAGSIPSRRMDKFDLHISVKHAEEQGIALPENLKAAADAIVR